MDGRLRGGDGVSTKPGCERDGKDGRRGHGERDQLRT
jgi:hypothetical protein